MYTSPDKLAETIALQQRLLREAMIKEVNMLKPCSSNVSNGTHKTSHYGSKNQVYGQKNGEVEQKYEWKVSGTRLWKIFFAYCPCVVESYLNF